MQNLWIIPILPLLGFAVNGLFGRRFSNRVVSAVAVVFVLFALPGFCRAIVPLLICDVTDDAWDSIMTVALKQLVWCTRHAAPHLANSEGASIVNLSSAAAMRGVPGLDAYTAAKGAINALTR